jgi:hypothetical protein
MAGNIKQYLDVMLLSLVNMFIDLRQRPIQTIYNFPIFIAAFNMRNFSPPEFAHQFIVSIIEMHSIHVS